MEQWAKEIHLDTKGGPKGTEVPLARATYASFYIWLRLSNIDVYVCGIRFKMPGGKQPTQRIV